ncbi:formimidoylglutamase [Virgibacillus oceani]|uniref:formimidoylglutamase n=1 Tax=Virgibacillus oceani TaxID=1479511 RepID=UPI001E2EDB87|nr:formimidoylglutamase [Virgibacillus oceani]
MWQGRIDSETDKKQFRFHQIVQLKDINDIDKNENAFSIIGFECDEGVRRNKGRIGAAAAPNEIRKMISKLPYNIEATETNDVGNVVCENGQLENAQRELGNHIYKLLHQSNTPIILGGGHETLYGHYLGVRDFIGEKHSLGIVNIDAHFDMRDEVVPSSGTMFKQILDQDKNAGYLCLGIQEFGNTKSLFETADSYGCKYIYEENIATNNYTNTFETIDRFARQYDYIMLTLCTDSIISSEAPGVSAPSPFGLEAKVVRKLLRYIGAKENITSFDISEVNPVVDENGKTVRLAANLVAEVMKSLTKKSKGVRQGDGSLASSYVERGQFLYESGN